MSRADLPPDIRIGSNSIVYVNNVSVGVVRTIKGGPLRFYPWTAQYYISAEDRVHQAIVDHITMLNITARLKKND